MIFIYLIIAKIGALSILKNLNLRRSRIIMCDDLGFLFSNRHEVFSITDDCLGYIFIS